MTQATEQSGTIEATGRWGLRQARGALEVATFTGQWVLAISRLLRGNAFFPRKEFFLVLKSTSVAALPIVAIISFLVGLILSFLGAVVLRQFGAEFAVAYLVGFGMLRELGALMTAIIMAGRTGAAFAAEIASMKVNEELDALDAFGISVIEYLVVPRIMAITLMMPLLTVFANVIGILSGCLVAQSIMDLAASIYFEEMARIVRVQDFSLGIMKAVVFGVLIGTSGCLRGLQAGLDAGAVGQAATRAVVTGITLIILANAIIDWIAASYGF